MKKLKTRLRVWLIKKLFTEDEKYLLARAVEDRKDNLERIAVCEAWVRKDIIEAEIVFYYKLRSFFSTKDYK
jgi:hypothetical protein